MLGSDTLGYHMPLAARFAQDGRVFDPLFINADSTVTWLPHNNELLHATGLLLMRSDVLSPLVPVAFLLLALLAAWTIGRPWGLGAPALLGAAVVFAWPGLARSQPGSANSDVVAYAPLLAGIAMLVSGGLARRPLLLAGLGAGLALGTKPTVMASVGALTLAVWAWLALDARAGRRAPRDAWGSAAAWAAMLAIGAAPWFLRNLVATGNPLPWFGLDLGPLSIPDAGNAVGDSISRYLTDTEVWREVFGPGLRRAMGTAWPLIVALGLGGALAALVRGRSPALRAAGFVAVLAAAFYLVTPNGAAGPPGFPVFFENAVRYSMPALALGLALLPLWPPLERAAASWWWAAGAGIVLLVTIRAAGFDTLERVRLVVFAVLAALVVGAWLLRRGGRAAPPSAPRARRGRRGAPRPRRGGGLGGGRPLPGRPLRHREVRVHAADPARGPGGHRRLLRGLPALRPGPRPPRARDRAARAARGVRPGVGLRCLARGPRPRAGGLGRGGLARGAPVRTRGPARGRRVDGGSPRRRAGARAARRRARLPAGAPAGPGRVLSRLGGDRLRSPTVVAPAEVPLEERVEHDEEVAAAHLLQLELRGRRARRSSTRSGRSRSSGRARPP